MLDPHPVQLHTARRFSLSSLAYPRHQNPAMEKASEERARSSLTQMKPAHDCVHLNFDEFILPREKSRKQVDYLKARVCEWGEACLPFLIGGADGPSP